MDFAKVEDYSLFPWPERLWFVIAFLVIAVVVARIRPGWLVALWVDAWLLAVMGGMLYLPHGWERHGRLPLIAEIVLASGIPTGLTTLWLARTRRHRLLGMTAVQAPGAVAAYVAGIAAAAVIMEAIWAVT
ncbi:hypothetical protein [Longimicrobium sp.]|uniref:hypothetical protein n=1 Tax=Longimicrobium sp. TaxID=2029185 RepID=UPI003B3A361E